MMEQRCSFARKMWFKRQNVKFPRRVVVVPACTTIRKLTLRRHFGARPEGPEKKI
jgi:hypothetical protein